MVCRGVNQEVAHNQSKRMQKIVSDTTTPPPLCVPTDGQRLETKREILGGVAVSRRQHSVHALCQYAHYRCLIEGARRLRDNHLCAAQACSDRKKEVGSVSALYGISLSFPGRSVTASTHPAILSTFTFPDIIAYGQTPATQFGNTCHLVASWDAPCLLEQGAPALGQREALHARVE